MRAVPVFFATTEGQTRRITEYLVLALHQRGLDAEAIDLASPQAASVDWTRVQGALLGASLHFGKHQKEARAFVRANRDQLNARPTAFFSVSLAIASSNPADVEAARKIARDFADELGWRPSPVVCLAGRLAYTKYGWLTRLIMRRISAREGGPTDTSRDWELTRWGEVDHLADEMAARIRGSAALAS